MKINHIIIGAKPDNQVEESVSFYRDTLGLKEIDRFIDTGTGAEGRVLVHESEGKEDLEILIVPFKEERLPNPQHIALEVSTAEFKKILHRATEKNMPIRPEPPLNSAPRGVGEFNCRGIRYERFYLLDPARVNVEIMRRVE